MGAFFSIDEPRPRRFSLTGRGLDWKQIWTVGLVAADVAAFLISLGVSTGGEADPAAGLCALVFVGLMAVQWSRERYHTRAGWTADVGAVFASAAFAFVASGFVAFCARQDVERLPLLTTWILFPFLAAAFRAGALRCIKTTGLGRRRVLLVGSGETGQRALDALMSQRSAGYEVVHFEGPALLERFHAGARLSRLLGHFGADSLLVAAEPQDWPRRDIVQALVRLRIPFAVMPPHLGLPLQCERTRFDSHDAVLLTYRGGAGSPFARAMKVALDLTLAASALVVLAPLLLAIAAAIKIDGGPVLFAHRRIGAGGRTFRCLKFRSMCTDGDRVLLELLDRDPAAAAEWAATQKLRHDPRVTWVGKLLRQTSLDELPQLLNVLRLDMSLVGPRPIVAAEVSKYADDIAFYHGTRPGLTGLWQVSGRSDTSYERRVQLDSWYVRNWSFWHDIAIILKTVPAVLNQRGAR